MCINVNVYINCLTLCLKNNSNLKPLPSLSYGVGSDRTLDTIAWLTLTLVWGHEASSCCCLASQCLTHHSRVGRLLLLRWVHHHVIVMLCSHTWSSSISVVRISILETSLKLEIGAALQKCSLVSGRSRLLSLVIILRRRLILYSFVLVELCVLLWKMLEWALSLHSQILLHEIACSYINIELCRVSKEWFLLGTCLDTCKRDLLLVYCRMLWSSSWLRLVRIQILMMIWLCRKLMMLICRWQECFCLRCCRGSCCWGHHHHVRILISRLSVSL